MNLLSIQTNMAELLEVQNKLLSMKCCLCKNVLSVPPIMVLSEDGTELKCGRCENNNDKASICRNIALENMAMFFSFPCKYRNCNEMIPWREVESHEDACDERTIGCPIHYQECSEGRVQVLTLEEHCKRYHKENIYYETLNFSLSPNEDNISILISSNQQFIIYITTGIKLSEINVASLKKISECFTYDLKLSSTCNNTFVAYENQPISKYDEIDHLLRYIRSDDCDLSGYPHTKVEDNVPVNKFLKEVDMTAVKLLFGDISKIRYRITIVPKKEYKDNNKESSSEIATVENHKKEVNIVDESLEKLKKQLQCPICMEYMIDKIYSCDEGHVLCINCKIQLTECPSCRTELGKLRNFPLENLADEVVLPCLFSKNGCEFTGKLELLSQHERECVHK
ncbi:unnamed protein product [Phaedon cochleariae]|uniref:RING-type domain-containing protein n=1 Tax=Phaedon cochleariae TaxID=80249 RepID=A0A9P0DQD7_PHACE|nr:unnamed protein product [Phaedon cochleariae]